MLPLLSAWTLDSLISIALSSPAFESIELRRAAWTERAYQYGRLSNPLLSLEVEEGVRGIFLEQELVSPMVISGQRRLWEAERELLDVQMRSDSFALIIAVKALYIRAIYTKELVEITRRTVLRIDSLRKVVERGHRAGRFPLTHVLAMESRLKHHSSLLEMLESEYRAYLGRLSALLGVRVDTLAGSLRIPDNLKAVSFSPDSAIPVLTAGASSRIALYRSRISSGSLWRLSFYAGVWSDPASGSRWYSAGISIPVPVFDSRKGEARYWERMSQAYRMDSLFALRRIEGFLQEYDVRMKALLSRLEAVEGVEIPLALRMYDRALRNYTKGGASYLEVLDALQMLHEKRVERADYIMEILNMCMELESIFGRCVRR